MPVVPFVGLRSEASPVPQAKSEYMLMAAAQMHSEGRLLEQEFDLDKADDDWNKRDPDYPLPRTSKLPDGTIVREEAEEPEVDKNFTSLHKQLNRNRDIPPGSKLLIHRKGGKQFWYDRDDDYEHGFTFGDRPGKAGS